jgi:Na+-transporting NADH:ubiquinone oxidoreductase subunit NqrD
MLFDSPLAPLSCVSLLLIASGRLAFAIVAVVGLVWVYVLTALIVSAAKPILPKTGKNIVAVFLMGFIAGIYLFLLWFVSPFLTMGSLYITLLIPCCFISSNTFKNVESAPVINAVSSAVRDALMIGVPIIGLSLIREPLGFKSLSFPGGGQGIVELFGDSREDDFLPIRLLAGSSGAFLLLGYITALFINMKRRYTGGRV